MCQLGITGIPEGEEREKGIKNLSGEIMAESFPNLKEQIDIQVQEAQRVPNKRNPNRPTPRHIITKMAKVTDIQKQKVSYKGIPIRLSAEFSTEMLHGGREWQDIF